MTQTYLQAPSENSEACLSSSIPTPTIHTPPSGETSPGGILVSRTPSGQFSAYKSLDNNQSLSLPPTSRQTTPDRSLSREQVLAVQEQNPYSDPGVEDGMEEAGERPPMHRPTDGRSQTPLLKEERGRPSYDSPNGSMRPPFHARRSTFRSRSPDTEGTSATRKKYTYAGFFLILSLMSFVVQTETAVYIQHELGWNKAYCML